MLSKPKLIAFVLALVTIAVLACLWNFYPIGVKKKIITATSTTQWQKYQRLTKLLSLGMKPSEVEEILGRPRKVDALSIGERWIFFEDGSTAGWTCVAEFKRAEVPNQAATTAELCYVVNIQHIAFPDSKRFEMGERLNLKEPEGTIMFGYPNPPRKGGVITSQGGDAPQ